MMNLFLHLLAGHLIGDFALQTGRIATMKRESFVGLVVHVAIVTLVTLLLVLSIPYGWVAALLVGVGHLTIDALRTYPFRNLRRFPFVYFLADQSLHMLLLIGVAGLVQPRCYSGVSELLRVSNGWDTLLLITCALVFLIFTIPVIEAMLSLCLRGESDDRTVRITTRTRLLEAIERVLGFYLMLTPAIGYAPLVFVPHFLYRFLRRGNESVATRLMRPTLSFFLTLIVGWLVLSVTGGQL